MSSRASQSYSTYYEMVDRHPEYGSIVPTIGQCFGTLYGASLTNHRPREWTSFQQEYEKYYQKEIKYLPAQPFIMDHLDAYEFDDLILYLRLGSAMNKEQAQWVWDKWIIPNIPQIYLDHIKIEELDNEDMARFFNRYLTYHTTHGEQYENWKQYVQDCCDADGTPFKKVTFDLTKIGTSAVFAISTLMRYVQEFTQQMRAFHAAVALGDPIDHAFVMSHIHAKRGGYLGQIGHSLMDSTTLMHFANEYEKKEQRIYKYPLLSLWPTQWETEKPFKVGGREHGTIQYAIGCKLAKFELERVAA